MSWRLLVRREARSELAEAIDWYQSQHPDFGHRFLRAFLEAVNKLVENPYLFQCLDDNIRRVRLRLKDFSYNLLYFIQEDRVVIVACAHAKRRPGYWRDRLES
jgi:plasmid stabilization system protein ParE